jgi:hypothetical protein
MGRHRASAVQGKGQERELLGETMARYSLNANQRNVLTSWLYEQDGYLDSAINAVGVSARAAKLATPSLDLSVWIRTNTRGVFVDPLSWDGCGMVWWMRASEGLNITPGTRPPETAAWIAAIQGWDQSIVDAFGRVSQQSRDGTTVLITAENGTTSTMPAGQQLLHQRSLFAAVLSVLV